MPVARLLKTWSLGPFFFSPDAPSSPYPSLSSSKLSLFGVFFIAIYVLPSLIWVRNTDRLGGCSISPALPLLRFFESRDSLSPLTAIIYVRSGRVVLLSLSGLHVTLFFFSSCLGYSPSLALCYSRLPQQMGPYSNVFIALTTPFSQARTPRVAVRRRFSLTENHAPTCGLVSPPSRPKGRLRRYSRKTTDGVLTFSFLPPPRLGFAPGPHEAFRFEPPALLHI